MPPLESHALAPCLEQACCHLGLHPFPTPRGINSRAYGGRPACAFCDFCAGYGCPTGARGSTQEAIIPRAELTGRCEIRPRSMVREVTVGKDGRATGCIYVDEKGVEQRVRGRVLCVCCSAVESARLLLLSRSSLFPLGLANGSGLVGRNLQFHAVSTGSATFTYDRHPELPLRGGRGLLGRSVKDYYFLPDGVSALPKGGLLQFDLARTHPIADATQVARSNPQGLIWGAELKRRLRKHFVESRRIEFEVFHDFLPNNETYVRLDPTVVDRWGLPVAQIHLATPDHHAAAGRWLVDRGLEVFDAMKADDITAGKIGQVTNVMAHGTCRAGDHDGSSVLNPFCQSHEVPNLFVVDGSFMPTSGGAPSTLTIIANSLRTAAYILEQGRAGAFH
jgi:choline dehydrogenase-like flavoprotein